MQDKIGGTLRVSNDVIADLAGYAALECYGVVGMAYTDTQQNIVTILSLSQLRKGIDVEISNGCVYVTLHVVVNSGVNMHSVSQNLVASVAFMLKHVAQIDNLQVNVVIEGTRQK